MDIATDRRAERRDRRTEEGTALVAAAFLSLGVAAMVTAYLMWGNAEIASVRTAAAKTRALYDAKGELALARMLIMRSTYSTTGNDVLQLATGGTIPGTRVQVESMAGANDPHGLFYRLTVIGESDRARVTATQLVAERESFSNYHTMVTSAPLGITGILDNNYDPNNPPMAPPVPLSGGKIHSNDKIEMHLPGYRHFVNPVTGGVENGNWQYGSGAEASKQILWHPDESRPDAPKVPMPNLSAYTEMKNLIQANAPQRIGFSEVWADDIVRRNENGYHVNGDVSVLIEFEGTNGTFTMTLRERSGSNRTATLTGLPMHANPNQDIVVFVENGYDPNNPLNEPNQTVHVKGDIKGRMTIFAPTGDSRVAGNVRYVDENGQPAAYLDTNNDIYKPNPNYAGNSTLGLISEFDARLGIKPSMTNWPATNWFIDPENASWVSGDLAGQAISAKANNIAPVEDTLFGFLGGQSGNDNAEIHASILCRRGRVYTDGMNPTGYGDDSWAYRLGWNYGWISPYGRASSGLYRYGSTVTSRRPVTNLIDQDTGAPIVGWAKGQSIFDEKLVTDASPYYFRHNRPVFYPTKITNGD